jgi:hypothetical protein
MRFVDGDAHRIAIRRAGGGKDEAFAAMALHGLQQRERRGEIVAVVFERIDDGLAYIGKSGKVQHGLGLVLSEQSLNERGISHFALNQSHSIQRQCPAMAKNQIVEHDDALVLVEQVKNSVRADVAGSAGDEKGSLGHCVRTTIENQKAAKLNYGVDFGSGTCTGCMR